MQRLIPFVDHEIGYRLLEKLIACAGLGRFEIPAVVTTRENGSSWWPGVSDICLKANIPLLVYESPFLKINSIQQPDWLLLLSWKYLISDELISFPRKGVLNLHYSLLPAFRGVYPVNWAIMEGADVTGFTYHFVNEKIDAGEIFMQIEIPIALHDTARALQLKIDDVVCEYFDQFMDRLLASDFRSINKKLKNNNLTGKYYSRVKFEEAFSLDLNKNYKGRDFFNLLRGLTFFEGSKNSYIIDPASGEKIFISINIEKE